MFRHKVLMVLLMLWLGSTGIARGAEATFIPLLTLQSELFVMDSNGSPLHLPKGEYAVGSEKNILLLKGADEITYEVQGQTGHHNQMLLLSMVLVVDGENEDQQWLVLLRPDGEQIKALGSRSGVQARAAISNYKNLPNLGAVSAALKAWQSAQTITVTPVISSKPQPQPKPVVKPIVLDPGKLRHEDQAWVNLYGFRVLASENVATVWTNRYIGVGGDVGGCEAHSAAVVTLGYFPIPNLSSLDFYLAKFTISASFNDEFKFSGGGTNHIFRVKPGEQEIVIPISPQTSQLADGSIQLEFSRKRGGERRHCWRFYSAEIIPPQGR